MTASLQLDASPQLNLILQGCLIKSSNVLVVEAPDKDTAATLAASHIIELAQAAQREGFTAIAIHAPGAKPLQFATAEVLNYG